MCVVLECLFGMNYDSIVKLSYEWISGSCKNCTGKI